jgi:hypothetical protein
MAGVTTMRRLLCNYVRKKTLYSGCKPSVGLFLLTPSRPPGARNSQPGFTQPRAPVSVPPCYWLSRGSQPLLVPLGDAGRWTIVCSSVILVLAKPAIFDASILSRPTDIGPAVV